MQSLTIIDVETKKMVGVFVVWTHIIKYSLNGSFERWFLTMSIEYIPCEFNFLLFGLTISKYYLIVAFKR